jgi:hypothetical protein
MCAIVTSWTQKLTLIVKVSREISKLRQTSMAKVLHHVGLLLDYTSMIRSELKWFNIEMTDYFYVVKRTPRGDACFACRLAGRSNHQDEYNSSASDIGYSIEAKSSNSYNHTIL